MIRMTLLVILRSKLHLEPTLARLVWTGLFYLTYACLDAGQTPNAFKFVKSSCSIRIIQRPRGHVGCYSSDLAKVQSFRRKLRSEVFSFDPMFSP